MKAFWLTEFLSLRGKIAHYDKSVVRARFKTKLKRGSLFTSPLSSITHFHPHFKPASYAAKTSPSQLTIIKNPRYVN